MPEAPPLHLVLYGATGFTGRQAVGYMANRYGTSGAVRWAIAGRSASKLKALAEGFGSPPVIVADSADSDALQAMVAQTMCVVSFAGPFARYGSNLVAVCARSGVDYCDITGEIGWVREMIEAHDDTARSSGARIVPCCGHDSIPWDLTTMVLSRELKKLDASEQVAKVDFWDKIRSKPSGGTLETAMDIMNGPPAKKSALGYDPVLKTADGTESQYKLKANNVNRVTADPGGGARGFFVMAGVNANVVKRSNALLHYGTDMEYREGQAFSSTVQAYKFQITLICAFLMIKIPFLRWLARRIGLLPLPGDGPTEAEMAKGFLTVIGMAVGVNGGAAKATLTFPTDPGYKDTARMAVESGLALALEGNRITSGGGVLTPAACQGEVLLQRLLATGSTLTVSRG
ncbi:hypothetical protein AB1Y20_020241 [Prymnesium parvum]|uniref:Saccharopine dehydrogenase NADP binding domain-containing protein n=2 Tax=Prymnesium parvum TaxID=97485 RepID=A0AB34JU40_PRYPA